MDVGGRERSLIMKIWIPGKPIAKARPKFYRRDNYVGTYNPQETEEGRWLLTAKHQITKCFEGPVFLIMRFQMPIPKSTSKKKHFMMSINEIKHTKRPDLDNLCKFVKDCLNGEAWKDDSQVVEMKAQKMYSQEPGTFVNILEAE